MPTDHRTEAELDADDAYARSLTSPETSKKCRLCGDRMTEAEVKDCPEGYCWSCKDRPEAKRAIAVARGTATVNHAPGSVRRPTPTAAAAGPAGQTTPTPPTPRPPAAPRSFNPAERALITNLHAHLPMSELLKLLNVRLIADTPDAPPFTLQQLHAEIQARAAARPGDGNWSGLRRQVAEARRSGLLERITSTMVDDFAVVYQLSPAQVTHLKDVLAHAKEGR